MKKMNKSNFRWTEMTETIRNRGLKKSCMFRLLFLTVLFLWGSVFLCACGYSREEKQHRKEIEETGRENVIDYIEEKYGFTPQIEKIEVCEDWNAFSFQSDANGYVLAVVHAEDGGESFRVHISGEERTSKGRDDFQHGQIMDDGRAYFSRLVGYEIYDIALQYMEKGVTDSSYLDGREDNLLSEIYEPGSFETFLQEHPMNVRIDDCLNQDLTGLEETNADMVAFLKEYAGTWGLKAMLISWQSKEDYEKAFAHDYGRNGLQDFEIWQDGLYINSYAGFEEGEMVCSRFERQEFDGIVFTCLDQAEGNDLEITTGRNVWQDLGETRWEPLSEVYCISRDGRGEVVVYVPVDILNAYGMGRAVFIQHFADGKWWQYEAGLEKTTDKRFVFFTYHGWSNGSTFDFAVCKK